MNITDWRDLLALQERDRRSHNLITIEPNPTIVRGWRCVEHRSNLIDPPRVEVWGAKFRLGIFSPSEALRAIAALGDVTRYHSYAHAASELDFHWYFVTDGEEADLVIEPPG